MIFLKKIRLHVLGIDKNISLKGTAHKQAPEQDCANRTGSRVHVFWRFPDQEMSVTFPRAPQARAKKISAILVMFTGENPFIYPLREAQGVHDPLK